MSSDDAKVGGNSNGNRLRFGALLLVAANVVGAVAVLFIFIPDRSQQPFPQLSEIQRIDAQVYDPKSANYVTFEVPRSHWDAIFAAMLPARRDDHPSKWTAPGDLNLKLKNAKSFYIGLYSVNYSPEDQGAFSAGPSFESRVYYRGGKSSALEKAVADAFEASKSERH
jgi:hypothetical protein